MSNPLDMIAASAEEALLRGVTLESILSAIQALGAPLPESKTPSSYKGTVPAPESK